ncbi:SDR family oxidoreductase [Streptomyces sp. NPDC002889]|uniref:SDR family oxidoreductase n=1 Tax=Streptomyces sp. NPDC002889 TaxID=3364669 RepID=UPI0036CD9116
MSYDSLAGRTAVITGAASGMGAATAQVLASHGVRVALLARRTGRLDELAGKITAEGGQALAVTADVTDDESVASAVERIHSAYGPADLVVNCAGVMLPNPLDHGRIDEWQRMIDTNVTGALRVIRAFTADLVAVAADGRSADLVNISSVAAHLTFPNYAVYGATKAALTHLSESLRTELGPRDVRITNIEPGLTESELRDHIDNPELTGQLETLFRAVEVLTSEDIADLIAYTASRARHINLRQAVVLPTRQA